MVAHATTEIDRSAIAAHEPETERWPIPHAAMFIFSCASLSWIAIFAVVRALLM